MYNIKFNMETKKYVFTETMTVKKIEGNLEDITHAALESGISQEELTFAYTTMAKEGHTEADFGMKGFFMFSKK